jgi:hypothetical protein
MMAYFRPPFILRGLKPTIYLPKTKSMSRFISTLMRSTIMRMHNTRWIAMAIASLLTHAAIAQSHQDLAAVIAGGNDALSELVYSLQTTAYVNEGSLQIAGEGTAVKLDVNASNYADVNFSEVSLNGVNTVMIRFESATQAASGINASALSELESLANVVLLFTYDISASDAASLAIGSLPDGVTSYYAISIPE